MFWVQLGFAIASLILSYALAPKPPRPDNAIKDLDFDVPTADANRKIPVVFGRVLITDPNVVWWGNPTTTDIIKDAGGKK